MKSRAALFAPRIRRGALLALLGAAVAMVACSGAASKKGRAPGGDVESGDDGEEPLPPPPPPDYVNDDSGAFNAPTAKPPRDAAAPPAEGGRGRNPADSGVSVDATVPDDDSGDPLDDDAGSDRDSSVASPSLCAGSLGAGDLAIVEMMISSAAGEGDRGEWVEIQNTRDCILNLNGLHVESPRGTDFDSVDIAEDTMLPPAGTFVVADTVVDSLNHNLPGAVVSWTGTDALKNDGDTVTVKFGSTVIDELTYGSWGGSTPGSSVSFSVDCMWPDRSSWARWSWSSSPWTPGFQGTPNADNNDVSCY